MRLVDPLDKSPLTRQGNTLVSPSGRSYRIVGDIPILLVPGTQTIWMADASLNATEGDPYQVATLGINNEQRAELKRRLSSGSPHEIDPVVQFLVAATNGRLYRRVVGSLNRYPIPELRLPQGNGKLFLDVGCSWGRWSIAAARKGYRVTAIDPSLGAVLAGRRVSRTMNLDIDFVVADARFLPFTEGTFDQVFSYSVLQHLDRDSAKRSLQEIGRVLRVNGSSLVQMPNAFGVVSLAHLARRRFSDGSGFDVRYWTPRQLAKLFRDSIGTSRLSIDGFFGLGIQNTDLDLMPWTYRIAIRLSTFLRKHMPFMKGLADSLYVHSSK